MAAFWGFANHIESIFCALISVSFRFHNIFTAIFAYTV